MQFDLLYEGPLPSEPSGHKEKVVPYKQCLRSVFSSQIKQICSSFIARPIPILGELPMLTEGRLSGHKLVKKLPLERRRSDVPGLVKHGVWLYINLQGVSYIPLILADLDLVCDLSITILAPQGDGVSQRDKDNRVKVIRDGLRIPHQEQEVWDHPVADPCFCLFEDDGELIGNERLEIRPLLRPPRPGREQEVVVWVHGDIRSHHGIS